jgi:hypothetical protein
MGDRCDSWRCREKGRERERVGMFIHRREHIHGYCEGGVEDGVEDGSADVLQAVHVRGEFRRIFRRGARTEQVQLRRCQ